MDKTNDKGRVNGEDTPENDPNLDFAKEYMDEMMVTFREMMTEIKESFGVIRDLRDTVRKEKLL